MPGDMISPSIGPVNVGGLNAPPMPSTGFFATQAPGAVLSPGMQQVALAVAGAIAAAMVLAMLKKRKG